MNGDFSRLTYRQSKHYSSVRLQQGRVLLDAEWNEQVDIQAQRDQATARDVLGPGGAPWSPAGEFKNFQIRGAGNNFEVADGHFYVDGLLVVAEEIVAYDQQPDFPNPPPLVDGQAYLVYLDVWERHLTALEQLTGEQPQIREVALGGPDTATRTRTVWQVKVQELADATATCADFGPDWLPTAAKSSGQLRAQTAPAANASNDCLVPEGGGYRRLENQLYRVEIHDPGAPGTATYKWSRDNGSILTKLVDLDTSVPASPVITVSDTGKDDVLGFAAAMWVEISSEERTLHNEPGVLLAVASVKGDRITLENPGGLPLVTGDRRTVRRWEGVGTVGIGAPPDPKWLDLEDGIQVEFSDGSYMTGDYWTIPARTLSGKIEWPLSTGVPTTPLFEPPHGTVHRHRPLALLAPSGPLAWTATDCRPIFPPLTGLTTLLYAGGDGQEALPGTPLPLPLRVRVVNGQAPVIGAQVQFTLIAGGGNLAAAAPVATLAPDGIAECAWTLGSDGLQGVQAALLDAAGNPVPGLILDFSANVSLASQVAYDPAQCGNLGETRTVQEALDKLCGLVGGQPQNKVMRITEVRSGHDLDSLGDVILNDTDLPVARLATGISIVTDASVSPESVINPIDRFQNAVCFVTLHLPFPGQSQRRDWGADFLGFQPMVLAADVSTWGDNVIAWQPSDKVGDWLQNTLFVALDRLGIGLARILARLTLKGNFVWTRDSGAEGPLVYLDGDAFGSPVPPIDNARARTEVILPSGDGRSGGDFEMWFWLTMA